MFTHSGRSADSRRRWESVLSLTVLLTAQVWAQPYSIWNDATVPAFPNAGDPNAVEVGLKFKSAIDGSVTGIRFYKDTANTGTHVGNLWTSTGTLLGSVTFGSETALGWQQQALATPVPISSNTTYIVSYHSPAGQYAADPAYFAAAGVDNYPLRALANGEDGPNGVYAYGPSGTYPNQTYNAANYWVDVVVMPAVTECENDATPPTIVGPADVMLPCAECNTDPTNTGTATATDNCSVTVTYSDVVKGTCPKVVTRTWTATDGAGNTASAVQTITCQTSCLVTDSSLCVFDHDPTTPVQDFRLLFTPDRRNGPCQKLTASNPGQFLYNVFYTGSAGQQVTFNISLPYPFVTQGARPIQAYDSLPGTSNGVLQCLAPGKRPRLPRAFFVSSQQVKLADYGSVPAASITIPVTLTVPTSGVVYLAIHLDYGLKRTSGYTRNYSADAVDCATGTNVLIPNHGSYEFSVGGAQSGAASIENINIFKRIPGVAGRVVRDDTTDPVPGASVILANAKRVPVGYGITDEDGFYMIAYKHTGKAATYYLSVVSPPPEVYTETQRVELKANAFVLVDFSVP